MNNERPSSKIYTRLTVEWSSLFHEEKVVVGPSGDVAVHQQLFNGALAACCLYLPVPGVATLEREARLATFFARHKSPFDVPTAIPAGSPVEVLRSVWRLLYKVQKNTIGIIQSDGPSQELRSLIQLGRHSCPRHLLVLERRRVVRSWFEYLFVNTIFR